uniref:X8 domain-containing protein n=1 Tax=Cannabis sativa TaxID=3483 RepID=A0A803P9U9_CANSA
MAVLAFLVLILAMTAHTSSANWCVCKSGLSEGMLQKTLDYACGAGADCNPIHTNGVCYNPNTVLAHCNYAVNSYFQKKGQAQGACDFAGSASLATSDPSTTGCSYPSSASTTPSTGVLGGGMGGGMGPTGQGINTDESGGFRLAKTSVFSSLVTLFISGVQI